MAILSVILFISFFIFFWIKINNLNYIIEQLQKKIQVLEKFVNNTDLKKESFIADKTPPESINPVEKTNEAVLAQKKVDNRIETVSKQVEQRKTIIEKIKIESPAKKESIINKSDQIIKPKFMQRFEKSFAESWTGILGSIIIVMGIAFLGIYSAIHLSEFLRFILIIIIAIILYVFSKYIEKKKDFEKLSNWVRSSAGAVFLFACLAAGYVPAIKWINNYYFSIVLLSIGIGLNLFLGVVAKEQHFASIHVVISIVALMIPGQSYITFIAVFIIVLFGIIQSYKSEWEYHLLLVILSFFVFHLYWNYHILITPIESNISFGVANPFELIPYAKDSMSFFHKIFGVITTLLIGVSALFVHYKKEYSKGQFKFLPLLVHIVNWYCLGFNLLVYSRGSRINTIFFAIASLSIFILSRYAKKKNIRWLYICDTLTAQLVGMFAVYTLSRWNIDSFLIMFILIAQVISMNVLFIIEKEHLLVKIFGIVHHLLLFVFLIFSLNLSVNFYKIIHVKEAVTLFLLIIIELGYHGFLVYKTEERSDSLMIYFGSSVKSEFSLSVIFIGFFTVILLIFIKFNLISNILISILLSSKCLIQNRAKSRSLPVSIIMSSILIHFILWGNVAASTNLSILSMAKLAFPFMLFSIYCSGSFYNQIKKRYNPSLGIYLFFITFYFVSYKILISVSAILPGLVWLLLAPCLLEISKVIVKINKDRPIDKIKNYDRYLMHFSFYSILLFVFRHLFVHVQLQDYFLIFKVRFAIELFAILVFLYMALSEKPGKDIKYKSWNIFHNYLWELIACFSVFTILLEVPANWGSLAWILSAVALLISGTYGKNLISRYKTYSVILFWIGSFHIAFISGTYVTPSSYLYDQAWLAGLISIIFIFLYIMFLYSKSGLSEIFYPPGLKWLKNFSDNLEKYKNKYIYNPVFLAVALFLYWSFSKSLLTLLWILEIFIIFILGVFYKDRYFRYVALSATVICVIRLMVYDLSQTSTLVRAFVFLFSGILLLGMNSLYNKYKDRFE